MMRSRNLHFPVGLEDADDLHRSMQYAGGILRYTISDTVLT